MLKTKNIIISVIVLAILLAVYFLYIKSDPDTGSLVSSPVAPISDAASLGQDSTVARDFLSLLLSVKNIRLDDSIFSDQAFLNLNDSSFPLVQDGNEGRPNPFAPLGSDSVIPPVNAPNAGATTTD